MSPVNLERLSCDCLNDLCQGRRNVEFWKIGALSSHLRLGIPTVHTILGRWVADPLTVSGHICYQKGIWRVTIFIFRTKNSAHPLFEIATQRTKIPNFWGHRPTRPPLFRRPCLQYLVRPDDPKPTHMSANHTEVLFFCFADVCYPLHLGTQFVSLLKPKSHI